MTGAGGFRVRALVGWLLGVAVLVALAVGGMLLLRDGDDLPLVEPAGITGT